MVKQQYAVDKWFSSAKQSQQLSEAEAEIQRLKTEIEKMRSDGSTEIETQLQALQQELQSQSGILSISVDKIQPNHQQPRQTFLAESIEAMSRSLEKEGQLQPIILIEGDPPVLFDGERRWRSAKALGWSQLEAVIIPKPKDLHRKALLTSLHREDLNPLDKAEAVLKELANATQLNSSDIPRLLSTAIRRLNKQKRMQQVVELMTAPKIKQQEQLASLEIDEPEQAILGNLLDLQLNPASIDANVFSMLALANDLKQAIRSSGLKGVHAMALQTLNAKNLGVSNQKACTIRASATQQVLATNLSATQTRKLVKEIRSKYTNAQPSNQTLKKISDQIQQLNGKILAEINPEQIQQLQNLLTQKLAEIEAFLKTI